MPLILSSIDIIQHLLLVADDTALEPDSEQKLCRLMSQFLSESEEN